MDLAINSAQVRIQLLLGKMQGRMPGLCISRHSGRCMTRFRFR